MAQEKPRYSRLTAQVPVVITTRERAEREVEGAYPTRAKGSVKGTLVIGQGGG
jgi:hypothetical protein